MTDEARVATGAAWLDEHLPGWWRRINLETLDISSQYDCVLGQLYGRYDDAPQAARWEGATWLAAVRGFTLDDTLLTLTEAWRDLITIRRGQDPPETGRG